jgi:hypothetical protein
MGWSESISLTNRILTRSSTVNRQSIGHRANLDLLVPAGIGTFDREERAN